MTETAVKPFTMPKVPIGKLVYWYHGADKNQEPLTAIVTQVGFENLGLSVIKPSTYNMYVVDGVRHVDDPRARENEFQESGGWQLMPLDNEILRLRTEVSLLQRQFLELAQMKATKDKKDQPT